MFLERKREGEDMEAKEVGNKVKKLMKMHNYTEKALAEKMGITAKTLAKKLAGKQEFYASEIISITEIFKLDIKECAEVFFDVKNKWLFFILCGYIYIT